MTDDDAKAERAEMWQVMQTLVLCERCERLFRARDMQQMTDTGFMCENCADADPTD